MEKVKLTDICRPKQWKTIPTSKLLDKGYPVYGANGIIGYYSEYNHQAPVVAVTCRGATCGTVNLTVPESYVTGNAMCLDDVENGIEIEYLYYCLKHYDFSKVISGSAQPQITRQGMEKIYISIGTYQEQVEIVNKLKKCENIIQIRQQQLQKLDALVKARFVEMFGDKYPLITLGEVVRTTSGGTPSKSHKEYYEGGTIPWLTSSEVNAGIITSVKNFITEVGMKNSSAKLIPADSVVVAMYGATAGVTGLLRVGTTTNQAVCSLLPSSRFLPEYLYYAVASKKTWMISQCKGGGQPNISQGIIKAMQIINAPLKEQAKFANFAHQVNQTKAAIQTALTKTQQLYDSLMQQYFG